MFELMADVLSFELWESVLLSFFFVLFFGTIIIVLYLSIIIYLYTCINLVRLIKTKNSPFIIIKRMPHPQIFRSCV